MSNKSSYYLKNARAAYVTLVGLAVALMVFLGGSSVAGTSILVVTAVIAVVVHLVVDRPRALARSQQ